ncbi:MAG: SDR family NAD(P)-dependent oxidoreductase, partial [Rhodospirillaceae bacterium]|nr:SDR family NAD(P)-dependent oxidoreductase [Rhodospirillaceae bacterium]
MINMSSQAGKRGWPELSVYGATKAGVLGMNRALAVELAPRACRGGGRQRRRH